MNSKIKIQAKVLASLSKTWECYVKAEHIVNWNFAIDEWCCPKASNDLVVGGKFSARMEARDSSFGFDFEAIYNEIIPLSKIQYTMTDGRIAVIQFSESDNATNVEIEFEAEETNSIELQRDGWQAILNNFKKYVERI